MWLQGSSSESSWNQCGGSSLGGPVALGIAGISHAREPDDAEAGSETETPPELFSRYEIRPKTLQPVFKWFF